MIVSLQKSLIISLLFKSHLKLAIRVVGRAVKRFSNCPSRHVWKFHHSRVQIYFEKEHHNSLNVTVSILLSPYQKHLHEYMFFIYLYSTALGCFWLPHPPAQPKLPEPSLISPVRPMRLLLKFTVSETLYTDRARWTLVQICLLSRGQFLLCSPSELLVKILDGMIVWDSDQRGTGSFVWIHLNQRAPSFLTKWMYRWPHCWTPWAKFMLHLCSVKNSEPKIISFTDFEMTNFIFVLKLFLNHT